MYVYLYTYIYFFQILGNISMAVADTPEFEAGFIATILSTTTFAVNISRYVEETVLLFIQIIVYIFSCCRI
jgi:hypothetical protein